MTRDVSVCFVYFKTLALQHLDAAWYSLSKQDFSQVNHVYFLDNNTDDDLFAIQEVLNRYPLPVPVIFCSDKHGRSDRTQSWSVNRVCQMAQGPIIFFTRADYILAFDALALMVDRVRNSLAFDFKPFVSGWCWQMAYDREAANLNEFVDVEQYGWREGGMAALMQHPYAFRFHETDRDAGVWCTLKAYLAEAGWMNEKLTSWGYQQSSFQTDLQRAGVRCEAIQDYLFAHQHHWAPRDFTKANEEYARFGARG